MMNYFISNTDKLKKLLQSFSENRCSLSEEDVKLLNECISLIEHLERSPPSDSGNKLISELVETLVRMFANEEFQKWLDNFI